MRIASLAGPLEVGVDAWRWIQTSKMDQAAPKFFSPNNPHNVGDWFLTKIVDRLVDYEELVLLQTPLDDDQLSYVNSECDALVLRGGNYLERGFLSRHVGVDLVRRLEIPVVLFGAGIQTIDDDGSVAFEPEDVEILRIIADRAGSIAVRGERSADTLSRLGISNISVTGCPTVFWSRRPRLELRQPSDHLGGFTFRESLYSSMADPYRAQFAALDSLRNRFASMRVILQGEEVLLQYLHQARNWNAEHLVTPEAPELGLQRFRRSRLEPAVLLEAVHQRYDDLAPAQLVDWVARSTFFSWDIAEYLDFFRTCGMVLGCRLHSNLLAISQGVPAFYLTYDDRTREIVDLLGIPGCELTGFGPHVDPFESDWGGVEKRYAELYLEMRRFLELNGLDHRLDEANRRPPLSTQPGGR